jgi:hypothetical protein
MDKRKPHLSNLILSGQMSREDALKEIARPPDAPERIEEDVDYVVKKLGLSETEFAEVMAAPAKSVSDYPNSSFIRRDLGFVINLARRLHYGTG